MMPTRHSRASGHPSYGFNWIPAFAGMTILLSFSGLLCAAEKTLTVLCEGASQAKPEKAVVVLNFTGYGWSVAKARAKTDETINSFLKKLAENNVAVSSMSVAEIKLKPSYQFNRDLKAQVASDFLVSRKVNLELENVPAVAKLMDASLSIGSFSLESAVLTVKDKKDLSRQAFENALEEGKIKAEGMAKAFGAKLGSIFSVEEISSSVQDTDLIDEAGSSTVKAMVKIRIIFSIP